MEDFQLVLRATGDPRALARPVQRLIESFGQHYALRAQTAEERLDAVLFQERAIALLATFFGVVAVVLGSIGIYALLSFSVTKRTSEIGIRMALGARQIEIAGLVLRELAAVVSIGIAAGIVLTLAGSRLSATMLFGVSAADPGAITLGVALFCSSGSCSERTGCSSGPGPRRIASKRIAERVARGLSGRRTSDLPKVGTVPTQ